MGQRTRLCPMTSFESFANTLMALGPIPISLTAYIAVKVAALLTPSAREWTSPFYLASAFGHLVFFILATTLTGWRPSTLSIQITNTIFLLPGTLVFIVLTPVVAFQMLCNRSVLTNNALNLWAAIGNLSAFVWPAIMIAGEMFS